MTVQLHLGDCLEFMRGLPDGCVDAVVTDPPYNVNFAYATYSDMRADYSDWCAMWLQQLERVCRGPIAISVGQANLSQWATIKPPTWWLAWWKPAAMGRCVVGFNNWEPIALYGRPPRQVCDVVRATIKPDADLIGHPCPKPLEWGVKQVEMLTDIGGTVLDPFMGSGTTGVACVQTGRSFIGCELDEGYFKLAEKRIREAQAQLPIPFGPMCESYGS